MFEMFAMCFDEPEEPLWMGVLDGMICVVVRGPNMRWNLWIKDQGIVIVILQTVTPGMRSRKNCKIQHKFASEVSRFSFNTKIWPLKHWLQTGPKKIQWTKENIFLHLINEQRKACWTDYTAIGHITILHSQSHRYPVYIWTRMETVGHKLIRMGMNAHIWTQLST